jgi:transcriptional regulator with XRE-family HTH domain
MIRKSINTFTYSMSDRAILSLLGAQLKQMRLNKNITQQQMGWMAGLSRSAISSMENDGNGTMLSFVQVLRALDKLEILNNFITVAPISPIQIAKLHGKQRQRASKTAKKPKPYKLPTPLHSQVAEPGAEW